MIEGQTVMKQWPALVFVAASGWVSAILGIL